jgi:FMN-dependent NADH-azoreductase
MHILHLDASARVQTSNSRMLSRALVERLGQEYDVTITYRDVKSGLPYVDEMMIGAYYTAPDQRTDEQKSAIALSDALVDELEAADVIVAGVPMYNFSVPASFKAWIDLVARVGRTFRYTDTGPVGLLRNKTMYVLVATGGTAIGSDIDYVSGYLRHVLAFIGITDVHFVAADPLMQHNATKMSLAQEAIETLVQRIA